MAQVGVSAARGAGGPTFVFDVVYAVPTLVFDVVYANVSFFAAPLLCLMPCMLIKYLVPSTSYQVLGTRMVCGFDYQSHK